MVAKDRVLCWNCRGARSREFELEIKHLMREYRPKVLILLELGISGEPANGVYK